MGNNPQPMSKPETEITQPEQDLLVHEFPGEKRFTKQCQEIRYAFAFGHHEGREFSEPDFAYFSLLQQDLKAKKRRAMKVRAPGREERVKYNGNIYQLNVRKCYWTGERLLILSKSNTARGTFTFFCRAVSVPTSPDEHLRFYAFSTIHTIDDIDICTNDYNNALTFNNYLYPYLNPEVSSYPYKHLNHKDIKIPAFITESIGSWETFFDFSKNHSYNHAERYLATMGWFLCLLILEKSSLVHCDMHSRNITVFGPGIICHLIDLASMQHLDDQGLYISDTPLSAFPDPCAPTATYNNQSDTFSTAMCLIFSNGLIRDNKSNKLRKKISELNNYANDNYGADNTTVRQTYSSLYAKFVTEELLNDEYNSLRPYLLGFIHPNPLERPSLMELFSDTDITNTIFHCISCVIESIEYEFAFTNICELKLKETLELLVQAHTGSSKACTPLLSLLFFALHFKYLNTQARTNHKNKIEIILDELTLSPGQEVIFNHYEAAFPGKRTQRLYDAITSPVIIQVAQEALDELTEVNAILSDLCKYIDIHESALVDVENIVIELILEDTYEKAVYLINERNHIIDETLSDIFHAAFTEVESKYNQMADELINHALGKVFTQVDLNRNSARQQIMTMHAIIMALVNLVVIFYMNNNGKDDWSSAANHCPNKTQTPLITTLLINNVLILSSMIYFYRSTTSCQKAASLMKGKCFFSSPQQHTPDTPTSTELIRR